MDSGHSMCRELRTAWNNFQLHVMDSRGRPRQGAGAGLGLSTPCNGFSRRGGRMVLGEGVTFNSM